MLQKIGDSLKGKKIIAYIIIGLLGLLFAVWGAAGIVDMDFFGPSTYAVKVDGTKIDKEEIAEAWRDQQSRWQQQFGTELPEDTKKTLQDNLLESYIRNALVKERTRDFGYRVEAGKLRAAIENEPAFQLDGKYNEQLALARLAQIGVTAEKFRADVRANLQNAELERGIVLSEFMTPQELTRRFGLEDEQREMRYALLPTERYAAATQAVDEAAVAAFYEKNRADWMRPEAVKLQYGELRLEQMSASVVVADSDLQDLYAANKDRYVDPEKRRGRHILISIEGGNEAAAKAQAEKVLAEVRAGKDFAALAKQYSKDSGSAAQGGDLGWAERSAFVGPFSDSLFSLKQGETSGLVKTEFGFHIIRLEGIEPGKARSYDDARAELEDEFRRDKAADLFGERQEEVQRAIEAPGADFAAIAQKFGLVVGQVPEFLRGAGGAPLGADRALEDVVFGDTALNLRRIAGPVPLGDDRFVIVKVLEHRKAAPIPLADVRDEVIARVRAERGVAAARAAADAAVKRLEAGEALDAVAKSLGVTAEPARFVGRGDPSVSAQVLQAAFASRRPLAGKPVVQAVTLDEARGAAIIVQTQARVAPAAATNAELQAKRISEAGQRSGQGDVAAYILELRRKADVEKNPAAFD